MVVRNFEVTMDSRNTLRRGTNIPYSDGYFLINNKYFTRVYSDHSYSYKNTILRNVLEAFELNILADLNIYIYIYNSNSLYIKEIIFSKLFIKSGGTLYSILD